MGWINVLSNTYDRCISAVGKMDQDGNVLLPIAHSTANAQIEITIDLEGNFRSATKVQKEDAVTIIPVTEDSGTRGNGILPHPLCDKLCYIAGDFNSYVSGDKDKREYFDSYIIALQQWGDRPQSNVKVKAILQYIKKENLITDLVKNNVLQIDDNGHIDGFKVENISQEDIFVRFIVEKKLHDINYKSKVWEDLDLFQEYKTYYLEQKENNIKNIGLCFVKGELLPISDKHPAKIRHTGDKAKIISANDATGYTYRGRFSESRQAVSVSYLASQKAHNALRWLIQKQGYRNDSEMIISWCVQGGDIPDPLEDTYDLFKASVNLEPDDEEDIDVGTNYAARLNKAITGYQADLETNSDIVIMSVDTADGSGQGRLSITFYSEFKDNDFFYNINKWHSECYWRHTYKKVDDKHIVFIGAPSPREIALSAYGIDQGGLLKADEKVIKNCVKRLLPCIVEKKNIPSDIVMAMVRNVGRPMCMSSYNFIRILSNTCAVIIKYKRERYHEEDWTMSLNADLQDRSYLFGRLLAIADKAENRTYGKDEGNRITNAKRYWSVFSKRPSKTWDIIYSNLQPYLAKLKPGSRKLYEQLIVQIIDQFKENEFSNQSLSENYILGYACQLEELRYKNNEQEENQESKGEDNDE